MMNAFGRVLAVAAIGLFGALGMACDLEALDDNNTCSGGGCSSVGRTGTRARYTCSGGDCSTVCERGAVCDNTCSGGRCVMECVAGYCEYRLEGSQEWLKSTPGHRFNVPANSKFGIRVDQTYHYICHYG